RGRASVLGSDRRDQPLAPTDASQPGLLEQPRDALATAMHADGAQIAVKPWCAVGASRLLMERADLLGQLLVLHRPRTGLAALPRVVPASGDAQHTAHGGDGMGGPMRLHESEPFDGIDPVSRANQAAAFFKISRSSRSVGFSRRTPC